jgi:hypothetical protein
MIEQIKPVVVGYLSTYYAGNSCRDSRVYSKDECTTICNNDRFIRTRASNHITKKAKFRPVYEKVKL